VNVSRARPDARARAAIFVGAGAAFVAAVDLARWIRPDLLLDPEAGWAVSRLALGLGLAAAAAAAGGVCAALFRLVAESPALSAPLSPLPFSRGALVLLTAAALAAGVGLRIGSARTVSIPFLEDEVNLVTPALELSQTRRDFADAIRPIPYGRPDPHEMIGVVYLRLLRESLNRFGATIFAIRLPSLVGGILSLGTAVLLARALLPGGGATLAAAALAGLRWHLILSVSGWHSILIAPLIDVSALLLLRARRRGSLAASAAAGFAAGAGAHFYLAAWAAGAGLLLFSILPVDGETRRSRTLLRGALFAGGFLFAAAPLFLLHEGRRIPYFGRTSRHSVAREIRIAGSPMPALAAAADALPAPWFLPDPEGRHDLEGASRLGWIVGVPVALALLRALLCPRAEISALLLTQAAAAFCAAVAGGQAGHPNGFRFGYLTTWTAVAAAAGAMALIGLVPTGRRRAAALLAVGLFAISGAYGTRQALLLWPARRATFDSFHGEDTLIGRAAARWQRQGPVAVQPGLGRSDLTIETVRRYRLDPEAGPAPAERGAGAAKTFRIVAPAVAPGAGERPVERVDDAWGRPWAVVLGRPAAAP
jgi:hypothetical protein